MALIDNQNKVIYWDEVNWQWLPYVRVDKGGRCYFRKTRDFLVRIECSDEAIKFLMDLGFCFSSLKSLNILEISRNLFLYNNKVYELSNGNPSITKLLSLVSGKSRPWATRKLKDKGIITRDIWEEFLSIMPKITYKGRNYNSYAELSEDLGTSYDTVRWCFRKGMSIDEVVNYCKSNYIEDHLGSRFRNQKDMAEHWGVPIESYRHRKRQGWSLKEILTTPVKRKEGYKDYKGRVFSSRRALCEAYQTSEKTLLRLKDKYNTFEEATYFLDNKAKKVIKDHLGNVYPTLDAMANYYGIKPASLYSRLHKGWVLEEALTTPVNPALVRRTKQLKEYKDFKGQVFHSLSEIAKEYGISQGAFSMRMRKGKTSEEVTYELYQKSQKLVKDHLGNKFLTVLKMVEAYNIKASVFYARVNRGWTLEEVLTGNRSSSNKEV